MFETLKEVLLKRIEKNSIKVNVENEIVYLKKSRNGWFVFYPPVNPETKEWNKINFLFGGKANAIKYLVIGIIAVIFSYGLYRYLNLINF